MFLMCLKAFLVGGAICVIGQLLMDFTKMTPARILVTFVCLGTVLGALGIYDRLIDFAGAGASIPLTGFGSSLAKGTREAVEKDGLLGVITGPLSSMSGGVTVAMLCSLVVALVTKSKDK